ncbi:MAG: histidinol dehydrogenase [Chloroflexi bacterium]|nr:histidinol dehydrogenase [Chloroflexota bacterium]
MRIIKDLEIARAFVKRSFDNVQTSPILSKKIKQTFNEELSVEQVVDRIIKDVSTIGDSAIYEYTRLIDGISLNQIEVTKEEIQVAYKAIDRDLLKAMKLAAERIKAFHIIQKNNSRTDFMDDELGQLVFPLEIVGVYAPGGTASYPSTVLMAAIPVKVAGVKQIILTTPPDVNGGIPVATLVAADIAGVDRIFKVGGAQAIAALAYGTQSIPKVDKICGPGNIFVTIAKKKVFGAVDIDGLHGPTETIILADDAADPVYCALDLLAQAEHDISASAIMITTSSELADKVSDEVDKQLAMLERRKIAAESIKSNGVIIIVDRIEEAIELANTYAPEHLCLSVKDTEYCIERIVNSGGIFVGETSPEGLGDYIAGPSHVMPTGGTARWSSPLSVDDFLKTTNVIAIKDKSLKQLGRAAAVIARAEGFTAHARAIEIRLKK